MEPSGSEEEVSAPPSQEDELSVAIRNQDRDAIRRIMEKREGRTPTAPTTAISEHFDCGICQDLTYKPCVNECGHSFCFWCLHQAMSPLEPSACPLCRASFRQFPAPCGALHKFLGRAYPAEYSRRATEVKEEEKHFAAAAPDLEVPAAVALKEAEGPKQILEQELLCHFCCKLVRDPVVPNCGHVLCRQCSPTLLPGPCPVPECGLPIRSDLKTCDAIRKAYESLGFEVGAVPEQKESTKSVALPTLRELAADGPSVEEMVPVCPSCANPMRKSNPREDGEAGYEDEAFPGCDACSTPRIELPCWHCKSCGTDLCDSCGSKEPSLLGKRVEVFGTSRDELNGAKGIAQLYDQEADRFQVQLDTGKTLRFKKENLRLAPKIPFVHFGVGCDGCGLYPIEGKAFKCVDCPEAVGFDLCGDCISRSGKMGRFNQNHTAEHRMEERPQEKMWLHRIQEARPDLSVAQIIELAQMSQQGN